MEEKIWMKNWPDYLPKKLSFPHGNIPVFECLRINAQRFPNKPAIIYYGREVSYQELNESIDRLANYFISKGLKKGDRVGLFMGNCPQYIITHFAIQRMGGIVAPVNPMFKQMELKYEMNDSGASALVTIDQYMPIVNDVLKDTPTVKHVVCTSFSDYLPEEPVMPVLEYMKLPRQKVEGTDDFMDIMKNGDLTPVVVEVDMDNDICLFEYTGGTTGLPKGAMHSHYAHLFKPFVAASVLGVNADSVQLTSMPYFHIVGQDYMLANYIVGSVNICLTQFDALAAIKAIDKYKVDVMYCAVPANLQIMNHPEVKNYDLSSLKYALTTSFVIGLTEEIAKQWEEVTGGCPLVEAGYGMSETHTMDTFIPKNKPKYGSGSVGIPVWECDIRITDLNDKTKILPQGEKGEISLKNPGCMKGYWNKPEATADSMIDGYIYTGDVGMFDEDGYLWWLGRFKEMIKVSGHSVFPEDVEAMLNQHPAIAETAVIPVKHEKKGEVVKAFVVLKPDMEGEISTKEIIEWAKKNMTPHKAPVYVEFIDELPKSGVKLLRRILRDREAQKTAAKNE